MDATTEGQPVRFLVCGDVNGQFESLAKNLENVGKKQGPFLFALCVGNFLGDACRFSLKQDGETDDYLEGKKVFCIPVYFIDSSLSITGSELRRDYATQGYKFSPTLEFLGGFGFRQLQSGLRIGFLSGLYNAEHFFTQTEEEEDIDIIVVNENNSIDQVPHMRKENANTSTTPPADGRLENFSVHEEKTATTTVATTAPTTATTTASSPAGVSSRRYFLGEFSEYYCRPVLQELKNLGVDLCGHIDLFLSCTWPTGVEENLSNDRREEVATLLSLGDAVYTEMSTGEAAVSHIETSPALSELIEMFEPRFHVASGGRVFYQRIPFRTSTHGLAAKFIGLGHIKFAPRLATERRLRFLHALVLKPIASFSSVTPLLAVPNSSTPSPYFAMYNPKSVVQLNDKRLRSSWEPFLMTSHQTPTIQLANATSKRPKLDNAYHHHMETVEEGASVLVSNMPFDISEESMIEILSSFGDIIDTHIPKTSEGRSIGKAWITYQTSAQAQRATAASEQLQSGGRLLRIQRTSRRSDGTWEDRQNFQRSRGSVTSRRTAPPCVDVSPHSDCWFCLANPNCEKRLVVAIGQQVYVALAKGGIVHQHVLVVPVTHFPNTVFCPPSVTAELDQFVQALRACYASQGLQTIMFERFFPMRATTGMHMQLQVIPIPKKCAQTCVRVFERRAERAGCPLTALPPDDSLSVLRRRVPDRLSQPYFYAELPAAEDDDKVIERRLFIGSADETLPFNFGREATAELLEVPDRGNWKSCIEQPQVESQLAQQMQKLFQPFTPKQ